MFINQKSLLMSSSSRETSTRETIMLTFVATLAILMLTSPDAFSLNAGQEMGPSVQRLDSLLQGNLMRAIMGVGIAASLAMAFFKASAVPVMIGIGSGVLYGFACTWVNSTFACCI